MNWLTHDAKIRKTGYNAMITITLVMVVLFIVALVFSYPRYFVMYLFCIIIMTVGGALGIYALRRSDSRGWMKYDTMRVSIRPVEITQLLSEYFSRHDIRHSVIEKPHDLGYVESAEYKIVIENEGIAIWFSDMSLTKRLMGLTLVSIGEKTGNNNETIERYKHIIEEALDEAGITVQLV